MQAPSSDAAPSQGVNAPPTSGKAGRAVANGDNALPSRAVANSLAAEDSSAHGTAASGRKQSQNQKGI